MTPVKIYTLVWNLECEIGGCDELGDVMRERPVLFLLSHGPGDPIQIIEKDCHWVRFSFLCFDKFLVCLDTQSKSSEIVDAGSFTDRFIRRFYNYEHVFIQIDGFDASSISEVTFSEKDSLDTVKLKLALMQSR